MKSRTNYKVYTIFACLLLLLFTCIANAERVKVNNYKKYFKLQSDSAPHYKVHYLPKNDIDIDGDINDKAWKKCDVISNLISPWDTATGTAEFRACYDKNFFYFSFNVKDSIGSFTNDNDEQSVAKGDRVELFFSPGTSMTKYYCMEISPSGHVLDYEASYHRNFNNKWNIKGATIRCKLTEEGYIVEGKISVGFFKEIKGSAVLSKGSIIHAGVYRARKKNTAGAEDFIWYSWVNPRQPSPDFHVPASLGIFEF